MNTSVTSVTRPSLGNVPNGFTATSQNQFMAGQDAIATATAGINKGGMRGAALAAVAIAEYELKEKSIDLASDYYDINKRDYIFFRDTHQPAIKKTAEEAFSEEDNPTYEYDSYSSVPSGMAKASKVEKQWFEARRRIPKYNTGQARRLDYDMAVARTQAIISGWNLAMRYEYAWTDSHNNRAYKRKIAVANLGIGVGNIVNQGFGAAVSQLSAAYDGIGDTIASLGNGYASNEGYKAGRKAAREQFKSTD